MSIAVAVSVAVAVVGLCLIILMLGILYRRRYLRTKRWREKGLGFFPIQRSLFQTKQSTNILYVLLSNYLLQKLSTSTWKV